MKEDLYFFIVAVIAALAIRAHARDLIRREMSIDDGALIIWTFGLFFFYKAASLVLYCYRHPGYL